jgi:sialate O-acetylesterase
MTSRSHSSLSLRHLALVACLAAMGGPADAAAITHVGFQAGVEQDANDPTVGWRNTTPAKPLDIDGDHILGTDGYEVSGLRSNPSYAWITVIAPNQNGSSSWGLWDHPATPSGSDSLGARVYHDASGGSVKAFEIVINGNGLQGKTLRLGVLYGVNGSSSSTFTLTQTVGGNDKVTTPALAQDGSALNVAYFNITGAEDGDTFIVGSTIIGGGVEQVAGITFDSAPTSAATQLPEPEGVVREQYEAPLEVCGLFSDNAVLQRGTVLPVWGWDDPGTVVTVQFAGQAVNATADAKGRWTAQLQPLAANATPQQMTIAAGAQSITIQNLLVGDVWLCSGQSNMEMDFNGTLFQADMPDSVNPDNWPEIRHMKIASTGAEFPQKRLPRGNDAAWSVCDSTTVLDFTAVGFFFAQRVTRETGVPIGLLNSTMGNTRIGSWVSPEGIDLVTDQIPRSSFRGVYDPEPCTNYFGQIAPLVGFALKGALWYQGEANGGEGDEYFWKMKALIEGWRNAWQRGDFPFYYAQLPSYTGSGDGWAPTREAQRKALTLSNTGMAVLVDVGDTAAAWPINLHPPNKYDVGQRLALWALANDYGATGLVHSGPLFQSSQLQNGNVVISFDHVGGGLMAAKKPSSNSIEPPQPVADLLGFQLAGSDNQWHAADASIQGATVVLSAATVPQPVKARYLYAMNTDAGTLYNQEGLPAAPFLAAADTTPVAPGVPAGLNAIPGNARVDLTWSSSSSADSYHVKRALVGGGPYTTIGSPAGTSFPDTTAANGTTYYYVVSAVNTVGESADSPEVNATPQAPPTPPQAPTGLNATPGDARVDLSWNASGGATSYKVKRASVEGGPYTIIGTPGVTSFPDTTAANGTTYYYVVSAVNTGGEGANSSEVNATPQAPPTPPQAPTGLNATAGDARVDLSWNASSGATSYKVKRAAAEGGP